MIPPEATQAGDMRQAGDTPPAVCLHPIETLQNRPDFLKANGGRRQGMPGFLLQARQRDADEADTALIRVGFTCSKKVGNAVARNRAKRRLREIARQVLPLEGRPGWDYVLIGRPNATASRDFADMLAELRLALRKIHSQKPPK
ncbi:MAG: ribonuclease P protein component [Rhodobacteraceae bacterium]|nr:ribonuclease P protein component [Paracoccaceae bacterium]